MCRRSLWVFFLQLPYVFFTRSGQGIIRTEKSDCGSYITVLQFGSDCVRQQSGRWRRLANRTGRPGKCAASWHKLGLHYITLYYRLLNNATNPRRDGQAELTWVDGNTMR